ncbi:13358_t:CDS:2, partial [Funneliformis geosporum]
MKTNYQIKRMQLKKLKPRWLESHKKELLKPLAGIIILITINVYCYQSSKKTCCQDVPEDVQNKENDTTK